MISHKRLVHHIHRMVQCWNLKLLVTNNFIDLQKFILEIKCKITRTNDADLRSGADAANTDSPYFSNNALHGYYEDEPAKIDGADNRATDVAARKALVAKSLECFLLGKPASDILTCDKYLLSGLTLRIFRRSSNNLTIISESNKHYRVKLVFEQIFTRKITVADHVLSAIEIFLLKTPAVYRYTEVLPRFFLATTGISSCSREDIF